MYAPERIQNTSSTPSVTVQPTSDATINHGVPIFGLRAFIRFMIHEP